MTVRRVCYKYGVRFDEGYYTTKHLPLVGRIMEPHGVKRVEMVKLTTTPSGTPPSYQIQFSAHFDTPTALQNARQDPHTPEVLADIQKFYGGMPDIMIGQVAELSA